MKARSGYGGKVTQQVPSFFTIPVLEEDTRAQRRETEGVEGGVVRPRVLPRQDRRLQVVLVHHADAHQSEMMRVGIFGIADVWPLVMP